MHIYRLILVAKGLSDPSVCCGHLISIKLLLFTLQCAGAYVAPIFPVPLALEGKWKCGAHLWLINPCDYIGVCGAVERGASLIKDIADMSDY